MKSLPAPFIFVNSKSIGAKYNACAKRKMKNSSQATVYEEDYDPEPVVAGIIHFTALPQILRVSACLFRQQQAG
jgi:hypothetical protein